LIKKDSKKVYLIAEMSGNHQGSLKKSIEYVKKIIDSDADAIKFQVYTPDTITYKSKRKDFLVKSKSNWDKFENLYSLYTKAYTPWNWIEKLANICDKNKYPWFASPFDVSAVNFLEELNCKAYKLASPEITDLGLIKAISSKNKPVIISTGLASFTDLDLAVNEIKKKHKKIAILKCTSAYPAPQDHLNLNSIPTLRKKYKCAIGYSDHTVNEVAPIVATVLGATIIEKHFKIDGDKNSIDHHFSFPISKISKLKKSLDDAKVSLGLNNLKIMPSVKQNLRGKRSLYAIQDIKKNEVITNKNVKSIRPSFGLHPKYLEKIINKKAKKNIEAGERISLSKIKI
tara:strand:- start:4120 stop:5148 length:1029 start_codon:yes stop_codon:yes gene_type:complete